MPLATVFFLTGDRALPDNYEIFCRLFCLKFSQEWKSAGIRRQVTELSIANPKLRL